MTLSPISRLINLIKLEKHDLKILPVLIFGYGLISIATPVSVQALVNIGGVVGALPMTGLTLPFLSYGGSSLIASMAAAGLLLNVARAVKTSQ